MHRNGATPRLAWYRELYDRIAWTYDFEDQAYPFYVNEERMTRWLLTQHVPAVPANEERWALDLGCGPGQYTVWLLEHGYHVLGIDVAPNMIHAARQATLAYGDRAMFHEGDLMALPATTRPFAVAIAFGSVINHLDDWDAFFSQVAPRLASNGLLLLDLDNIVSLHQLLYTLYSHLRRIPGRPSARELLQRISASLSGANFQTLLPIETHHGVLDLPLTYGSLALVERAAAAAGLPISARLGVNTLASLLPNTTLSVSYRTRPACARTSRLEGLLAALDQALATQMVSVAGLQFVVCHKHAVGSRVQPTAWSAVRRLDTAERRAVTR